MPIKPPAPNTFTKLNFIVGYFWQKCDVPWRLYVQFAQAPTNEAVLLLIGLDFKDMVKEFFRPAGLRSGRHGRKGNKSGKRNVGLLDPSQMFAEKVPGYEEYRGRPFGSPTFWMYEITDVIDRVAWSLACVDALTDIGYGTLLGIIQDDPQNCPLIGRMFRVDFDQTILSTQGGWAGFPVSQLEWVNNIDTPNGYVATVLEDARYAATLEVRGQATTPGETDVGIGIYDYLAGVNLNETGLVRNVYPAEYTASVDAIFTGPGTIGCSIYNTRPGPPGPGGQHMHLTSIKWLITQISPDASA